jgi:hypothetical protein
MSAAPSNVPVVGATGGIGRRVVAAAHRHDVAVTALVRDLGRGERVLPGVELAEGDLEQTKSLSAAGQGVDAIAFTHRGSGSPDTPRRIDYGGVANVLRALDGATPRLALMTSIGASRRKSPDGSVGRLLDCKRRSERLAEVLVLTETASGRTSELLAEAGPTPCEGEWNGLFAAVAPDVARALDSAADPDSPPSPDAEPPAVREDLSALKDR